MTNRIHIHLPMRPMKCTMDSCVYIKNGICDNPKCGYKNSDSSCYKMPKKKLITLLSEI